MPGDPQFDEMEKEMARDAAEILNLKARVSELEEQLRTCRSINFTFCPRCGRDMNPKHDPSAHLAKPLTADEMLARIEEIHAYSEKHPEEWRNQVASQLNELLARAEYVCNTSCGAAYDESDQAFCAAGLAICLRVEEFESIKRAERSAS